MKLIVLTILASSGVLIHGIPIKSTECKNSHKITHQNIGLCDRVDLNDIKLYNRLYELRSCVKKQIEKNGESNEEIVKEITSELNAAKVQAEQIVRECKMNVKHRKKNFCNLMNKIILRIEQKLSENKYDKKQDNELVSNIDKILESITGEDDAELSDFNQSIDDLEELVNEFQRQNDKKDNPQGLHNAIQKVLRIVYKIRSKICFQITSKNLKLCAKLGNLKGILPEKDNNIKFINIYRNRHIINEIQETIKVIHQKIDDLTINPLINSLTQISADFLQEIALKGSLISAKKRTHIEIALKSIREKINSVCHNNNKLAGNLCKTLKTVEINLENIIKSGSVDIRVLIETINKLITDLTLQKHTGTGSIEEVSRQLKKIIDGINKQIERKNRPNHREDNKLLKLIRDCKSTIQRVRNNKCSSKPTAKSEQICSGLKKLEDILQEKIDRKGKLNVVKDKQIIQIIIGVQNVLEKGHNSSTEFTDFIRIIKQVSEEISKQISRKDKPDQKEDAKLLEIIKTCIRIVQNIRGNKCGANNKDNNQLCSGLKALEDALQDKINKGGKLDEVKDKLILQICGNIQKVIDSGNGNISGSITDLIKILKQVSEEISKQISRKDKPDQKEDAKLLEIIKTCIRIVQNIRGNKCGANNKDNNQLCSGLKALEDALQDKINKGGKLDEVKDKLILQICGNIQKVIDSGNGNISGSITDLIKILKQVSEEISKQISRKDKPDQKEDAKLLEIIKTCIRIVQNIRSTKCGANNKDNNPLCSGLKELEDALQNKINKGGKLDEVKDKLILQICGNIQKVIDSGNGNISGSITDLIKILKQVSEEISKQISRKDKPDQKEDAKLLEIIKTCIRIVQNIRGNKCGANNKDNNPLCSGLKELEDALQDKINKGGKLDEVKDELILQICGKIQKVIDSGDGNISGSITDLIKILKQVSEEISKQISRKDKPEQKEDAKLLEIIKTCIKIVQNIRGNKCGANNKDNNPLCSGLKELEDALQDKINKGGKLDEVKDKLILQICTNIQKVIDSGNGNTSGSITDLIKILKQVSEEISKQISRKDKPDQKEDAKLLEIIKTCIRIVQNIRGNKCGANNKDNNPLCSGLKELEDALQDKINKGGKLDEVKDKLILQICGNIQKVIDSGNGNISGSITELIKILKQVSEEISKQISRKDKPDQKEDAKLLEIIKTCIRIVQNIRGNKCGANNKDNNPLCSGLKELEDALQDKINKGGKLDEVKDKLILQICGNIQKVIDSGNGNTSGSITDLIKILKQVSEEISKQISRKDKPDQKEDAKLLEIIKTCIRIVQNIRGNKCGANNKDNNPLCSGLKELEDALQDKINKGGKLDEVKDKLILQICGNIQKVIGSDNGNTSGSITDLIKILKQVSEEISKQISRKDKPDQKEDAKLLEIIKTCIRIVQNIRGNKCGANNKDNNALCSGLKELEDALQDKINKGGKLDEVKDKLILQICGNIQKVIGSDNGNTSGSITDLIKILKQVSEEISKQISRKDKPDQKEDAKLLEIIKTCIKIVQNIRGNKCGANNKDNNPLCSGLKELEDALQDKINKGGKLDEVKDKLILQICGNIQKVIDSGNGNTSGSITDLIKILKQVSEEISKQISRKDKPDQKEDAKLLEIIKTCIRIVQNIRGNKCGSNNKENSGLCSGLKELEDALQDKINKGGKLDEVKDKLILQICGNIQKVIDSGNGNTSGSITDLIKILKQVSEEISKQISRKDKPDQKEDDKLLEIIKTCIRIVQNIRGNKCGANNKDNNPLCSGLKELEDALQYKINKGGKLDEVKDKLILQICGNIQKVIDSGNGNTSGSITDLIKILKQVSEEISKQISRKDKPDQKEDAKLLEIIKTCIRIVQNIRGNKCGANNKENSGLCSGLKELEDALQDKINKGGKLDEVKDKLILQICGKIQKVIDSGDGNISGSITDLIKILKQVSEEISKQISRKDKPDQKEDAKLLEIIKTCIKIVQNIRGNKCGSNNKENSGLCSGLKELEDALQDKINKGGKLDEVKDKLILQICGKIQKVIDSGDGNISGSITDLIKILKQVSEEISKQISRKDKPDQKEDAKLLEIIKTCIKIVQNIRGNKCGSNNKENSGLCSGLKELEDALQDKINKGGKLDEVKDKLILQICGKIQKVIDSGDGNISGSITDLIKILKQVSEEISKQISRKDKPDQKEDAKLLEIIKTCIKIVQNIRGNKCGSNNKENSGLCSGLKELEDALQDKINKGGKLDEVKDKLILQICGNIQKVIDSGNGNISGSITDLIKILKQVSEEISKQISRKDKPDQKEDAKLLEIIKTCIRIVQNIRGNKCGANNKENSGLCSGLKELEDALQDKINKGGKLDEVKDKLILQICGKIQKVIDSGDGNISGSITDLIKILKQVSEEISKQISRKDKPDQKEDAKLLEIIKTCIKIVQNIRGNKCGSNNKENSGLCSGLKELEDALQDKINKGGKLDEVKDKLILQICGKIQKVIDSGDGNISGSITDLIKILKQVSEEISKQISRKDKPDQKEDAKLLEIIKTCIKIVQNIRGNKCGSNNKENSGLCSGLKELEDALQDKINKGGKLDEVKDKLILQICGNIQKVIGSDNGNTSGSITDLIKILKQVSEEISKQISRKDKPDQKEDAKLLEIIKTCIKIVQNIRGNKCGSNNKENSGLCSGLKELEDALQDKINKGGKLDEVKDKLILQICGNIQKVIGSDNGNTSGSITDLIKILKQVSEEISKQISRKDKPDQKEDAKLLEIIKTCIRIVQNIRGNKCGANNKENSGLCSGLKELEDALQDKINKGGKLDEVKDKLILQICGKIQKVIDSGDGNISGSITDLIKILKQVSEEISKQISRKDKPDQKEDAKLLEIIKTCIKIVQNIRGNKCGSNNKENSGLCSGLKELEDALQDKINKGGKLDEVKDKLILQICGKIQKVIDSGDGNISGSITDLIKILKQVSEEISKQISRKDKPDQKEDAKLLEIIKTCIRIVQNIRGNKCGSNNKENSGLCSGLKELEDALQDKINKGGKLDEVKDKLILQICGNIQKVIDSGNGNISGSITELIKILKQVSEEISKQIYRKDKPDQKEDAKLLETIKNCIKIVQNIRGNKCGANNKDNNGLCSGLKEIEDSFLDKIKRGGKLDVVKDKQIIHVIGSLKIN